MRTRIFTVIAIAASTLLAGVPLRAAPASSHGYGTPRFNSYDRHDQHSHDHRHDHDYGRRDDHRRPPVRLVKLGSVVANCRDYQNDVFEIRSRQRYSGIVFKVDRGDVAIDLIRVTFGDDSSFLPDTKVVFHEGERSCRIDFPSYNREIKRVRIRYQSLTRGVSVIDVYGIPCD